MYQLATTSVSILRGSATNAYGDVLDAATAIKAGIPAALDEVRTRVSDGATQQPRVVRVVQAVLPAGTDIVDTDRLLDEQTGVTYAVEAVQDLHTPGRASDVVVQLQRTT